VLYRVFFKKKTQTEAAKPENTPQDEQPKQQG